MRAPARLFAVGLCLAAAPVVALAQPKPGAVIATPPSVALIAPPSFGGCYAVTQDLYGPYRLDFCLTQDGGGAYEVSGGTTCRGGLGWQRDTGQATIRLDPVPCTGKLSWSADRMTCTILYVPPTLPADVDPRVAIPAPSHGGLQCLYEPSVPGHPPMQILAERRN